MTGQEIIDIIDSNDAYDLEILCAPGHLRNMAQGIVDAVYVEGDGEKTQEESPDVVLLLIG
tara:strand:+ start:91 stop:273 length:183 start_codon:yes stop_codon:yes gene_type:complete